MSQHNLNHDRFHQLEWLLNKRLPSKDQECDLYEPYYGDVTELNTNRLILDSVGKDTLKQIAEDAIDLLGTSVSIYESNGDYAFGIFSSGWCQLMDTASRKLCDTDDNRSALDCGRWLCHENCWNDSAKKALESGHSTDIECVGGINLYAEPIYADEKIVGVINIGYGTPPSTIDQLKELADLFEVDLQKLKEQKNSYNPRPKFFLDLAKKRLKVSAKIIGEIVNKSILQKSLQENEERLRLSSEYGGLGLWALNLKTSATWRSLKHDQIFGYETLLSEWTYDMFLDHVVEEDRQMVKQKFNGVLDNAETWDFECRIIRKDGSRRWIWVQGNLELDANHQPTKMLGVVQDITERKSAERERLTLKMAVDQAPVGIALADEEINIYYCNPKGLGVRGGDEEDLIGIPKDVFTNWQVLMLNGKPYEVDSLPLVRAITKGESVREDFIVRHQDGSDHICDASAYPIYENGRIIGGMVIFLNITDRIKAEKIKKESEKKYKELFDSIRDAILVTDINRSIIDCNPAFSELFGYSNDEIIGKSTQKLYQNEEQFQELGQALQNHYGKTPFLKTVNYLKKNGEVFPGETNIFYMKTQEGEVTGFIGLIRDITKQKKLELQVRHAQKMESIGSLAGGIAHEFNNMLAIIIGNNELIMDESPQGSLVRESTEEIRIAGLRGRDMVKQLLTFSRQDNAANQLMDLKKVVQESMKLIRSSTPANIKIEQHLSANACPVMGNDTQISQLLINLCNNAVDAMPEKGGIITVELLNETVNKRHAKNHVKINPGQYAKLTVSDNGVGMDNDIIDRIFEPYFTTKNIGEGTGIGMAVVHGIVGKHGGTITVDSIPGRGSTFTIFLPVHDGLIEKNIDEQNILPGGDEHILYVDDEPAIAKLGKRLLESLGYTTESICDPEEALDIVRNDPNKFDLLITDMAMPGMTGDQFVTEALKIRQDMPTIICTGYSANISETEATEIGAHSFVMKPINKSELAETVRKVLDGVKKTYLEKP